MTDTPASDTALVERLNAKPVGYAYQDKRWDKDHWHLCGWDSAPRPHEGREIQKVYLEEDLTAMQAAEQRATQLRIALNDIIALDHHWHGPESRATEIARAALLRDDDALEAKQ